VLSFASRDPAACIAAWTRCAGTGTTWHALWDVTIEVTEVRHLGDTVLALARLRTHGEVSGVDLESPIAYVFE
jgi:hypothetical protein